MTYDIPCVIIEQKIRGYNMIKTCKSTVVVKCNVGSGMLKTCDLCNALKQTYIWHLSMPIIPTFLYGKLLANARMLPRKIHTGILVANHQPFEYDFYDNARTSIDENGKMYDVYVCRECMADLHPKLNLLCLNSKRGGCTSCLNGGK